MRVDASSVAELHRWMERAGLHGFRRVRRRGGSGGGKDVRHVQGDDLSQTVEVAVVGRSIQASRRDDVEGAQGSEQQYAEQGRPSGGVNTVGNCMARPHEGSEALLDIDGCGNVGHADASILEEFKLSSLASNKRDGRVGADCDEIVGRSRHVLEVDLSMRVFSVSELEQRFSASKQAGAQSFSFSKRRQKEAR